jgi:hypothetical protein
MFVFLSLCISALNLCFSIHVTDDGEFWHEGTGVKFV